MKAVFLIGRILAGAASALIVTALVLWLVYMIEAGSCTGEDCEDRYVYLFGWAVVCVPVALLVGGAGLALIHDTQAKV